MPDRRYRVLTVAAHPVQYASANFRELARHPLVDLKVAYCSLRGAEPALDPEFGATVQWDVPLLDGYDWIQIPNRGHGGESFWGLWNPGLWKLVRSEPFAALICLTGYQRASFWLCYFAARSRGIPFFFGTDAPRLDSRGQSSWKIFLRRLLWPRLFRLASQVIVVSTPGREMMASLGIPQERIALLHNTVDNNWWIAASDRVDRSAVRASLHIDSEARVIIFCAKLQPWKRPSDLLRAFAKAAIPHSVLLIAGEGPLRASLEAEASTLALGDRIRFLGFINQSKLPALYAMADLMVLPSEREAFAMVVNEAMLCGCPVAVSDRVGAARDLVAPVAPDLIFPHCDVDALATTLLHAFSDPGRLQSLRFAVRARMDTWSPKDNVAATVNAIERAHAPQRPTSFHPTAQDSAPSAGSRGSRPISK